jgi:hypothetical protein
VKSTKRMLLGVIIALLGVGLAQPEIIAFLFRSAGAMPSTAFATLLPVVALLLILVGVVIGIIGFFQND